MKAAIYDQFGPPDVLQYREIPDPEAGPGEIIVKVHAVTVNRVLNCAVRAGEQTRRNVKPPHVGGVDPAGVVVSVGEDVESPAIGTRVACLSRIPCLRCGACEADHFEGCANSVMLGVGCYGGDAELVKVPASVAIPIPDTIDFAEAAAVLRHGPTAHNLLFDTGDLKAGETILVMGAAGGLGLTGIQVAKAAGARVICAAGARERVAVGLEYGADFGVDYTLENLTEAVMRYTEGQGVNLVFENISNPLTWPKALACLQKFGRLVTAGSHGGGKVELDCGILYHRNLRIFGATGNTDANVEDTLLLAAESKLRAKIEKIYPLSEAAEAHRHIEAGVPLGKIVLDPTLG